jgi:hypothetical protein
VVKSSAWALVASAAIVFAESAWAHDPRCDVFPNPRERARCVCALRLGGWVTEVHNRWRVIYVRRHQERYCYGRVHSDQTLRQ